MIDLRNNHKESSSILNFHDHATCEHCTVVKFFSPANLFLIRSCVSPIVVIKVWPLCWYGSAPSCRKYPRKRAHNDRNGTFALK
jgi:hypothetical protein